MIASDPYTGTSDTAYSYFYDDGRTDVSSSYQTYYITAIRDLDIPEFFVKAVITWDEPLPVQPLKKWLREKIPRLTVWKPNRARGPPKLTLATIDYY